MEIRQFNKATSISLYLLSFSLASKLLIGKYLLLNPIHIKILKLHLLKRQIFLPQHRGVIRVQKTKILKIIPHRHTILHYTHNRHSKRHNPRKSTIRSERIVQIRQARHSKHDDSRIHCGTELWRQGVLPIQLQYLFVSYLF